MVEINVGEVDILLDWQLPILSIPCFGLDSFGEFGSLQRKRASFPEGEITEEFVNSILAEGSLKIFTLIKK